MTLPAPKLDDRSFQDLVDDAKRFIQERCPGWTDHNVSDPGVTLIEAFAWMTDLTLYRLNRVPDRLYVKFLELLGVALFPPKAAEAEVDFVLSTINPDPITVPRGTIVATERTPSESPVTFTTVEDLEIRPVVIDQVISESGESLADHTARLGMDSAVKLFSDVPEVDDAVVLVLDRAAPRHTLRLRAEVVRGAGFGVNQSSPPLRWEASTADAWIPCGNVADSTGGFNLDGSIEVRLPAGHDVMAYHGATRALVRCRVVPAEADRPAYEASPEITNLTGGCIAAATDAVNATFVEGETLGTSAGVAGQEFTLQHAPVVVSDEAFVLHVHRPTLSDELADEGPELPREAPEQPEIETWELRQDFADSGATDRHFTLDRATGVIRFGPVVRAEDGSTVHYGAVPAKGAVITVPRYRVGGGHRGNVAANAISVLRTSVPYVDRVRNVEAARGGVDGETVEEAKVRGPLQLRSRNRAVTAEDFEILTREAAPEIRRVRCVPDFTGDDPTAVRVLVVPAVGSFDGRLELGDLVPADDTRAAITEYLDRRRLVGTRVNVEAPAYQGLRIKASILVQESHVADEVLAQAGDALYHYFNPVDGGPDGMGWPFGRAARIGEAYSVLQQVVGVDVVEQLALFYCDPGTGDGEFDVGDVLELEPNQLLLSRGHELQLGSS
ncbi:MAG: putative baseplate assembly protein [Actinomycetota bacterium]